jgi:hypothetical protein
VFPQPPRRIDVTFQVQGCPDQLDGQEQRENPAFRLAQGGQLLMLPDPTNEWRHLALELPEVGLE